ncbi:fasciclin domain-containing protein [Flavobacterium silvisoli]|uniref:Fasciclin domain-containing protein n=1 Tax=Flavobacterium silvisoli TaxID=2529433 RepID=A0A4Q9YV45_9FLAO|nr:fasciclin domain-containing protein [Flavobacterium silvisoli]TBX67594.1 fasciclin domain-containing protein [Flavobacterium silvisoli]
MKNFMKKISLIAVAFLAFSCSKAESEKSLKTMSIAEIATVTPELSSFVDALDVAGLTDTFKNEGNYTVFVPNNDAFANMLISLGYASLEDLEAAKPGLLASVLKYHVLTSRVLSTNLTNEATVTTLNGQNITASVVVPDPINYPNDNVISLVYPDPFDTATPPANLSSTITARDIRCSNGIIHTVDTVLLPLSVNAD